MSEDVFRRAQELERDFFSWTSGADRAGLSLFEYLRAHRSELELDSHWQVYYEDLDRRGLLQPAGDPDPAARRRADRAEWAQGSSAGPPPGAPPDAGRPRGGGRSE